MSGYGRSILGANLWRTCGTTSFSPSITARQQFRTLYLPTSSAPCSIWQVIKTPIYQLPVYITALSAGTITVRSRLVSDHPLRNVATSAFRSRSTTATTPSTDSKLRYNLSWKVAVFHSTQHPCTRFLQRPQIFEKALYAQSRRYGDKLLSPRVTRRSNLVQYHDRTRRVRMLSMLLRPQRSNRALILASSSLTVCPTSIIYIGQARKNYWQPRQGSGRGSKYGSSGSQSAADDRSTSMR